MMQRNNCSYATTSMTSGNTIQTGPNSFRVIWNGDDGPIRQLPISAIGFDRLLKMLYDRSGGPTDNNYPPKNIIKTSETTTRIEIAVAGIPEEHIFVTLENGRLSISYNSDHYLSDDEPSNEELDYIHRGISKRSFSMSFDLAEHMVVNEAYTDNGLLVIELEEIIPEEKKPKRIVIGRKDDPPAIEAKIKKK